MHRAWPVCLDFDSAVLEGIGEVVPEKEKLTVMEIMEERKYENERISGALFLHVSFGEKRKLKRPPRKGKRQVKRMRSRKTPRKKNRMILFVWYSIAVHPCL